MFEVKRLLDSVPSDNVKTILVLLEALKRGGGMLYVAGNGGSAANASHCAMHLRECGLLAFSLTDSVVHLTATGNDFGYERAFTKSLPNGAPGPGDAVLVFSCYHLYFTS